MNGLMRIDGDPVTWLIEFVGMVFLAAGALSFILLLALKPALGRYALAKPNARSSHKKPTPQGGGIAVVAATVAITAVAAILYPSLIGELWRLAVVFACVIALAAVGISDDVQPMAAGARLLLQAVAVAMTVAVLPDGMRVLAALPWWIERALLFVGILWFVNVVNFMDGIDWITVGEVVPVTAGLALFGLAGALPAEATLMAVALGGAMIGFAPLNRPVAQLFLGDVGSLPIGLLLGWLLVLLAGNGHLSAAALLPLYYVADATITLLRRLVNGENVMQAHRSHFYQRALDNGLAVYQIVGRVFVVNIVLVGLAAATLVNNAPVFQLAMLAAGCAVVAILLWTFSRNDVTR
jgi:UDP-N-acetylmuramyl pentapeptide phosphotransferase/UDP-N-acetylglucosamine-1-phosphate transferase